MNEKVRENRRWPHRDFADVPSRDVVALVAQNPLAWIVSHASGRLIASMIPVRAVLGEGDAIARLDGHFAGSNEQVACLKAAPDALVLISGPNGYMSPSRLRDRTQAPSWLYASVQFDVRFEFHAGDNATDAELHGASDAMERAHGGDWRTDEMGARYRSLRRGVAAFSAHVRGASVKFKLAQDERDDVCADIIRGLEQSGQTELALLVRRCNNRPGS